MRRAIVVIVVVLVLVAGVFTFNRVTAEQPPPEQPRCIPFDNIPCPPAN